MPKEPSMIAVTSTLRDEDAAKRMLINARWPNGIACPKCGCLDVFTGSVRKSHPYRCRACRKGFSVRTDSLMHGSRLPYSKWAMAIYIMSRSKGVSSLQLAEDIGVTRKTAWFMMHRIREAWSSDDQDFAGPVEVDETFVGGKDNRRHSKDKLRQGASRAKTVVVGAKDRATNKIKTAVVRDRSAEQLVPFVHANVRDAFETWVYTDGLAAYRRMWSANHVSVDHSSGQYVNGDVHTNGIESFWSMFKRGIMGVYHYISPKHTHRYAQEFAGRHNDRGLGVWGRIESLMSGLFGKRLTYRKLVGRRGHKHPWQIERAAYGDFEYPYDRNRPFPSWSGVGKAMYEWLRMQDGWEADPRLDPGA